MPQQKPSATGHAETLKSQDKDGDERLRYGPQILRSIDSLMSLNRHLAPRFRDDLAAAVKAALAKQEPDPRTRFHEQFRKEADEYDRDLHKKYHDDFNSTLIFVGHFHRYIVDPAYKRIGWSLLCRSFGLYRRCSVADAPRL